MPESSSTDPHAWLEEVHGEKQLAWVKEQNAKSLGPLKADPRYQAYYAGGDPYGPDAEKILAKSGQRRLPRGAWERAGLPPRSHQAA